MGGSCSTRRSNRGDQDLVPPEIASTTPGGSTTLKAAIVLSYNGPSAADVLLEIAESDDFPIEFAQSIGGLFVGGVTEDCIQVHGLLYNTAQPHSPTLDVSFAVTPIPQSWDETKKQHLHTTKRLFISGYALRIVKLVGHEVPVTASTSPKNVAKATTSRSTSTVSTPSAYDTTWLRFRASASNNPTRAAGVESRETENRCNSRESRYYGNTDILKMPSTPGSSSSKSLYSSFESKKPVMVDEFGNLHKPGDCSYESLIFQRTPLMGNSKGSTFKPGEVGYTSSFNKPVLADRSGEVYKPTWGNLSYSGSSMIKSPSSGSSVPFSSRASTYMKSSIFDSGLSSSSSSASSAPFSSRASTHMKSSILDSGLSSRW